jgi:hypothetical protein
MRGKGDNAAGWALGALEATWGLPLGLETM